jgi:hypothetical protein
MYASLRLTITRNNIYLSNVCGIYMNRKEKETQIMIGYRTFLDNDEVVIYQ